MANILFFCPCTLCRLVCAAVVGNLPSQIFIWRTFDFFTVPFEGKFDCTVSNARWITSSFVTSIWTTRSLLEQCSLSFFAPLLFSSKHPANTWKPILSKCFAKVWPRPVNNHMVSGWFDSSALRPTSRYTCYNTRILIWETISHTLHINELQNVTFLKCGLNSIIHTKSITFNK